MCTTAKPSRLPHPYHAVDPTVLTPAERLAGEDSQLLGALSSCHVALGRVLRHVERQGGLVLRRSREENPAAADYTGDIPFGDIGFKSKAWVEVEAAAAKAKAGGNGTYNMHDWAVDADTDDVVDDDAEAEDGSGVRRSNSTLVSPVVLRRRCGLATAAGGAGSLLLRSSLRSPYSSASTYANASPVGVASSPSYSSGGRPRREPEEVVSPMCLLRNKLSSRLKLYS